MVTSLAADEAAPTRESFPGRSFRAMWTATGVSQLGTAVSVVMVPLVAVVLLQAKPAAMAWLSAMTLAPSLLVRVPVAACSDSLRERRVPVMVTCCLIQAAIVALVPLLWAFHTLSLGALLVLAGAASLLAGVYASLSSPVLVEIVPGPCLADANGKIAATRSIAEISGPALGGALLNVLAAPLVILADAASFLASAVLLTRIRAPRHDEPMDRLTTDAPGVTPRARAHGLFRLAAALARRSTVRALIAVAFVNGVENTVLTLFMVRELHLRPSTIGLLLSLGASGGVCGGLLVGRILKRLGPGPTLAIGVLATVCSLAVLPFATAGPSGVAGVVVLELASSFGGTLMIATVFSGLQRSAPDGQVAQVMALAGTLLEVSALAGAPVGGVLATQFGLRAAVTAAFGIFLVTLVPQLVRLAATRWNVTETELK
jgi:predicted MFS family arabinose efflux permease